ncbi:DUF4227 family protein [Paenibacillus humicola]|uniref:DUF4227 family protein n=1 Tax=Paenibacillus humicola TaxID=3110540 RepID=UPI00237A3452|nr:DUF4227 family protein [Paenibacillus humicola]
MVVSVRKMVRRLIFIVLLVLLTFVTYGSCRYIAAWIAPDDPYRVPQGQALKVFQPGLGGTGSESIVDRLRLFYWYGE